MIKSKKGAFILALEEQIKLILLIIIILLVFVPLGKALYDFYFPGVDKELKSSIKVLVSEANDLKKDIEKRGMVSPTILVPTYLEKETIITAYSANNDEQKCKNHACFCIYQTKNERKLSFCKQIKDMNILNTKTIEGKSGGLINLKLLAEEKEKEIFIQLIT